MHDAFETGLGAWGVTLAAREKREGNTTEQNRTVSFWRCEGVSKLWGWDNMARAKGHPREPKSNPASP